MRQTSYRGFSRKIKKKLARYIDDVLSLNNSRFGDFVDRIYPTKINMLSIKLEHLDDISFRELFDRYVPT
jgi:hypothetical protein